MARRPHVPSRRRAVPRPPPRPRDTSLDHLLLTRYIAPYLAWMAVAGYSPLTATMRRQKLMVFVAWAHERGLTDPREITRPILERYQRHLHFVRKDNGDPLALSTQNDLLVAVKQYFKWLARENHLLANPASELQLPKLPKRLPRHILTVEDMERVLACADPATPNGLRDRALLELLYSTGIRRMEAAHLSCADLDTRRGVLLVREGKGGADRVVPVGDRALAWIEKYRNEARPLMTPAIDGPLFVGDYGRPLDPGLVSIKVKRCLTLAGLDLPGAAHLLRHACATHMLEGGADIRFIQALLGHSNLETTEIYTHVSIDKLKAIHAATHPARLQRSRPEEDADSDGSAHRDDSALL